MPESPTTLSVLLETTLLPRREAERIIAHVLQKSREFIITHPEYEVTKREASHIKNALKRRKLGEPMAYILGTQDFYGREFIVTSDTLIPRPETEMLVEEVLHTVLQGNLQTLVLLDIGTGSGIIPISVILELRQRKYTREDIHIFGTDISKNALRVAQTNAKRHNAEKDIVFLESHLLSSFLPPSPSFSSLSYYPLPATHYLCITANLPYVPTSYLQQKTNELTKGLAFEPTLALDGGSDGFDSYRKLLSQIAKLRTHRSEMPIHCFFEIGYDQELVATREIQQTFPNAKLCFTRDLAGHIRVVSFLIV